MDNNPIQAEPTQTEPIAEEPVKTEATSAEPIQTEPEKEDDKKAIKIKISKKTIVVGAIIAAIVILGILLYLFRGLFVAAMVNGSPIARWSVIQRLEKEGGKNTLDTLITKKLIESEAVVKNISISKDEVGGEIAKIKDQVKAQGGTIEAALAEQNMTMDDLKSQITLQKEIEKMLADKIAVTDEEVAKYIVDNKVTVKKGQEAATNEQVKSDLRNQKLSSEAQAFIADLKAKAKIDYFVSY